MKERGVSAIWLVPVLLLGIVAGIGFDSFSARIEKPAELIWAAPRQLEETESLFVRVAEEVKPSVVQIITTQRVADPHREMERFFRPFEEMFPEFFRPFRRHWEREPRAPQHQIAELGSGFIINKDGYIITNYHVIRDVDEIMVRLYRHEKGIPATVVGTDPLTDLAMIKIDVPEDLPTVRLGDSEKIRVGEWAIAVGNPFGLEHTVTAGIISGKGRTGFGMVHFEDFIQTDAPIHPGSSGGPLLNSRGEVIGVNTFIITRGAGMPMVFGFAIPINMVKDIYNQLRKEGIVKRGWLGVIIQPDDRGVLINEVIPGGPAARAGLKARDVIKEFEGKEVLTIHDLQREVARAGAGKRATVKIIRDGNEKEIIVKLDEMPATEELAMIRGERIIEEKLGFKVREADREEGVIVVGVKPDGPAAGIVRIGDIIKEINHISIGNLEDYRQVVERIESGNGVLLQVRREGRNLFFAIEAK